MLGKKYWTTGFDRFLAMAHIIPLSCGDCYREIKSNQTTWKWTVLAFRPSCYFENCHIMPLLQRRLAQTLHYNEILRGSLFCIGSILCHIFCSPCTCPNSPICSFFSSPQPFDSWLLCWTDVRRRETLSFGWVIPGLTRVIVSKKSNLANDILFVNGLKQVVCLMWSSRWE